MPSKKPERSSNEKKIESNAKKLCRDPLPNYRPLYAEINAEMENMEFSSSGDYSEKFLHNRSPRMPRKSNSPSSTDSTQDIPGSPKHRSERRQQNQMHISEDSESSDVDIETDNFIDTDHLCYQGQVKSEISPGTKFRKHLSPKAPICESSRDARSKRFNEPEVQSQRTEPSACTSNYSPSFPYNSKNLIFLTVILLISFLFLLYIYWPRSAGTPFMNDQFNASIVVKALKSKFGDQPPITFRIIHSALRKVLEMQPQAPAIILLLATNGSKSVISEFSHVLLDSLSVPEYTVKISGKKYQQGNTGHAKMEIDQVISKTLKNDQLGSVLIDDLDQIPGKAAMILHKYCDHEYAPFKKAVFVMTVNYNKAISDYNDTKLWDKAAFDHLLSVWTDIGVDQSTPLLSRLTVSVAVIMA